MQTKLFGNISPVNILDDKAVKLAPCPVCKQGIGVPCKSLHSFFPTPTHAERHDALKMAKRPSRR